MLGNTGYVINGYSNCALILEFIGFGTTKFCAKTL